MPLNLSGDIAGLGKIVQIVRATDATRRTTTSTSFVDASISVTISPTKSTSELLIIWSASAFPDGTGRMACQITDSSNTALSGAENMWFGRAGAGGHRSSSLLIGRSTPATTSAVTYKGRFRKVDAGLTNAQVTNDFNTGQLYAIEVAA
jgi:hypothetical protein